MALAAPAHARPADAGPTYVRQPLGAQATYLVKPARLSFSDATFSHLRPWAGWGTRRAVGHGTAAVNDCTPDCATGHIRRAPATVALTLPARRNGRRTYGCIRYAIAAPIGEHGSTSPAGGRCPPPHVACRGRFLGGFYRHIFALHVSCRRARRVVRAWVHRYAHAKARRITSNVRGWLCVGRLRHNTTRDVVRGVMCARPGRRIHFVGVP